MTREELIADIAIQEDDTRKKKLLLASLKDDDVGESKLQS